MVTTATTPDVEQLMNDYFAVRSGDTSKLDVLSDSFTFHYPFGDVEGRDAFLEFQDEIKEMMSDGEMTVNEIVVGDDFAMWEWTLAGTHDGAWHGIPASGRGVAITGLSKTVIGDGKVQENWAYFDSRDLLAQIGAGEK